jgi:hypothetical protein
MPPPMPAASAPPASPLPPPAPVPIPDPPFIPAPAEPAEAAPRPRRPTLNGAFAATRYRFTTGLRAGEIAPIRGDCGQVLLSYRSFATVVGVVAALVSAIVALAGLAAVLFLIAEQSPVRAAAAFVLTLLFATFIALIVPRVNVTLYDESHPALTVSQTAVFPSSRYVVATPNGVTLAELHKSAFSRLGRNRWTIVQERRYAGDAAEESLSAALLRKVLGKFSRRFETDLVLHHGGLPAGRILRRPAPDGATDILELTSDALDRRVAVALATLILGREP